jgi:hypothetical protein
MWSSSEDGFKVRTLIRGIPFGVSSTLIVGMVSGSSIGRKPL